jgi:hypothetical protein
MNTEPIAEGRAFENPSAIRAGGYSKVVYGMDKDLLVEFFVKPVHMEYLSETMGFPIFQDRVWVRIVVPGNNKNVWETLAAGIEYDTAVDPKSGEYHTTWAIRQGILANGENPDPEKYPNAWERFMKRGQKSDMGWPVEEWGVITRSYAETLKMLNIPTVEALAALTDAACSGFMGGRKYRDLAKAALDERERTQLLSQEQAKAARAEERNTLQDEKIRELEALITAMKTQYEGTLAALQPAHEAPKRGPGRPPKMKEVSVKVSQHAQAVADKAAGR